MWCLPWAHPVCASRQPPSCCIPAEVPTPTVRLCRPEVAGSTNHPNETSALIQFHPPCSWPNRNLCWPANSVGRGKSSELDILVPEKDDFRRSATEAP